MRNKLLKNMLIVLIVIVVEMLLTFAMAKGIGWTYNDLSFFSAMFFVVITYYFSSSGGFTTKLLATKIQAITQVNMEVHKQQPSFKMNVVVLGSLINFIVTIFLVFII